MTKHKNMEKGFQSKGFGWLWGDKSIESRIVIWILIPYSIFCGLLASMGGYNEGFEQAITGVKYQPYLDKLNWVADPLFFIAVLPLLYWSGNAFLKAWTRLSDTKVLKKNGAELSHSEKCDLIRHINCWRWPICLICASILAICLMKSDMEEINQIYRNATIQSQQPKLTYGKQMDYACKEPDFFVKWLFDAWAKQLDMKKHLQPACARKKDAYGNATGPWGFNRSSSVGESMDKLPFMAPDRKQIMLKWVLYAEQFTLIFIGAWVLFQLLLYPALFAFFNRLPYARKHGLSIELNSQSSLKEFGLEYWNQVLNNIYWALSLALMVPIASKLSQANPSNPDEGQQLISIWIPVLLLAPMIANIMARQAYLPAVWQKLARDNALDVSKYHEQRLWPLDQNWSSKLGIIVAFALASFFLGTKIVKTFM